MEFEPDYFQQYAGLVYRYDEETQYVFQVTWNEEKGKILQVNTIMPDNIFKQGMEIPLKQNVPVWLRLSVNYKTAVFSWSQDVLRRHRILQKVCGL